MKRKRFIKLSMAQGCSRRVAVFAADYVRDEYKDYQKGWNDMYGQIHGRFGMYVN